MKIVCEQRSREALTVERLGIRKNVCQFASAFCGTSVMANWDVREPAKECGKTEQPSAMRCKQCALCFYAGQWLWLDGINGIWAKNRFVIYINNNLKKEKNRKVIVLKIPKDIFQNVCFNYNNTLQSPSTQTDFRSGSPFSNFRWTCTGLEQDVPSATRSWSIANISKSVGLQFSSHSASS